MLHKCLIGVPRSKLMKIKLITTASTYLMFVHSLFLLQLYQGSINPCTLNSTGQFWCNEHQFALANIYSTTTCKNEEKHSINTFQSLDLLISSTICSFIYLLGESAKRSAVDPSLQLGDNEDGDLFTP